MPSNEIHFPLSPDLVAEYALIARPTERLQALLKTHNLDFSPQKVWQLHEYNSASGSAQAANLAKQILDLIRLSGVFKSVDNTSFTQFPEINQQISEYSRMLVMTSLSAVKKTADSAQALRFLNLAIEEILQAYPVAIEAGQAQTVANWRYQTAEPNPDSAQNQETLTKEFFWPMEDLRHFYKLIAVLTMVWPDFSVLLNANILSVREILELPHQDNFSALLTGVNVLLAEINQEQPQAGSQRANLIMQIELEPDYIQVQKAFKQYLETETSPREMITTISKMVGRAVAEKDFSTLQLCLAKLKMLIFRDKNLLAFDKGQLAEVVRTLKLLAKNSLAKMGEKVTQNRLGKLRSKIQASLLGQAPSRTDAAVQDQLALLKNLASDLLKLSYFALSSKEVGKLA